jgi:hypothetical protein
MMASNNMPLVPPLLLLLVVSSPSSTTVITGTILRSNPGLLATGAKGTMSGHA